MQVDKEDAEQGRDRRKAFLVEQDKDEQYKDAGYFDGSASRHAVHHVVKKVDQVAGHRQHNKSIELPEPGLKILGKRCCFLVFQLV